MEIEALYQAARDGDRQAEERLFSDLGESFHLYLRQRIQNSQDAQEVVQDVLLTIADKYKEVRIEKSFAAWAYKVFEHKLFSYYRAKRTRQSKFVGTEDSDLAGQVYTPDPELKRRLVECLKRMGQDNRRYAEILDLHFQGYSGDEIGAKLGASKNSVLICLSRARARLRQCLEKGNSRR
jgi:RNA polymerase sigma factor (sigma-70 family)